MIKAIVFDCFGVLAGKGFWDVYKAGGGDPVKDNDFITSMVDKANRGQITDDQFCMLMADKLHMHIDDYNTLVRRQESANNELLDYIRDELKPHYKLGVLSNATVGAVSRKLDPDDYSLFDAIIESAATDYAKPDPEIFELAARKLGVTFDEMVFIDDIARFVAAAAQLGIHTIHYTGFDAMKQQLGQLLA